LLTEGFLNWTNQDNLFITDLGFNRCFCSFHHPFLW